MQQAGGMRVWSFSGSWYQVLIIAVPVLFGGRRSRERQEQKARGLADRELKSPGELLERSHVRTVHGKGPARHLLRTVRSKPVWFPVHRDGAPSARTVARGQSAYQSVSAITRFG